MKATGIIRRIDDLGRIVIPKEIRNSLRLKEGNTLEISVENDQIILSKYKAMKKIEDFAQIFTDSIYPFLKHNIVITDTDHIIAFSGSNRKSNVGQELSKDLEVYLDRHENILESSFKELTLTSELSLTASFIINTIMINGDPIGLIIIFSENEVLTDNEKKIADIVTNFMEKYLEE
jgi:AbrB family transcriptional regulator (stage V sporulation protein T)